jgi:hypothetical protein
MTRKQIIYQILRFIYNGEPNDDADITPNLVNQYLNEGIAQAVKAAYAMSYNIDQVGSVPDGFYMTTKGLSLTKDSDTGYYHTDLPQVPVAISKDDSITDMVVLLGSGRKRSGVRVEQKELGVMFEVRIDSTMIYYWIEGKTLYAWSNMDISDKTCMVRQVITQGTDLDDTINCPDDLLDSVIKYTTSILPYELLQGKDVSNEGHSITNAKSV